MMRILGLLVLSFGLAASSFGHDDHEKKEQNAPAAAESRKATGFVFHDENRNGKREEGESGIADVRVSNGRAIVRTNAEGRYELPVDDDTILFVIKPRDWMTPVDANQLPKFYYIHKPAGSPKSLRFAGVDPTGPLPASVDFPLYRRWEPKTFKALFFGDTQPRDVKEVEYIAHDVIEPLIADNKAIGASFGVTLGDVVFDDLAVFEPLNRAVALLGIPWYNVIGNHDINLDAKNDEESDETWERHYGPAYYSFDHGPVHFLALDDIRWEVRGEGRGRYVGGFGPTQMEFIRNDLALIPKDQLVVIMMHIPLTEVEDRKELYDLISQRPFAMSVSAHTHYQQHVFIDEKDGFKGSKPHHHVINVTVCGSWWRGAPDERGIPHTTMRDGAPNGYSIFSFDGHDYSIEFRPASRPKTYQMNIYAPEVIPASKAESTEILVNVFAGSERSKVEMRFGEDGDWVALERVDIEDPAYVATKAAEDALLAAAMEKEEERRQAEAKAAPADATKPAGKAARRRVATLPFIPLPETVKSSHIWKGMLPKNPAKGTQVIHVRTTDLFGAVHVDRRSIRID
ncbi:MAG: calcineurin-like phosphoesterase family protein [Isosphaeraceae bacterium]|nr:calcineurin-like phosphoesterase family protein [Isosphaeraceae bacterium]